MAASGFRLLRALAAVGVLAAAGFSGAQPASADHCFGSTRTDRLQCMREDWAQEDQERRIDELERQQDERQREQERQEFNERYLTPPTTIFAPTRLTTPPPAPVPYYVPLPQARPTLPPSVAQALNELRLDATEDEGFNLMDWARGHLWLTLPLLWAAGCGCWSLIKPTLKA